ncbi:MAG: pyridoxal 5'-phosphate synthase glutaminase subunit PdxT [Methanoregulaceae archaeon]
MGVKIGVLALQGNVSEHIGAFERALKCMEREDQSSVFPIKQPAELQGCDALAIPGGESTTISRLIDKNQLHEPIRKFHGGIFATCAGMVLVATCVDNPRVHPIGLIDMTVNRNAFGRQRESFEADLVMDCITGGPFHAIFIRAPVGTEVGKGVNVLARIDRGIVAVEYGKHMALAFHPELGSDTRLHELFLKKNGI